MINLIITIFGGLMIIAGFYAMSFGFATPPNILFFLLGLCVAVLGLFLVIIFSSGIEFSQIKLPSTPKSVPRQTPVMKSRPKPVKVEKKPSKEEQRKETIENIEKIKPRPRIRRPKKVDRPDMSSKTLKDQVETPQTKEATIGMKEAEPKKGGIGETAPSDVISEESPEIKKSVEEPGETEVHKVKEESEKVIPVKTEERKPKKIIPVKSKSEEKVPEADKALKKMKEPVRPAEPVEAKKPPVPRRPDLDKLRSAQKTTSDDEYVKKRLDRLKESYIQNAKDIEGIIDERLDSFKGTLGKLKSESREPGIIWSFDAGDVQEALMDTISKANNRILMMYPWIRNIDVGILKKFMDTESCMIVQEASLDDDASVELLKLLIDKNVQIRTMPHVHTIAVVADDTNGLIISTDPIYESYEVGVVYKDQKSIEEIERLFEDAWSISQDIDLEIR